MVGITSRSPRIHPPVPRKRGLTDRREGMDAVAIRKIFALLGNKTRFSINPEHTLVIIMTELHGSRQTVS